MGVREGRVGLCFAPLSTEPDVFCASVHRTGINGAVDAAYAGSTALFIPVLWSSGGWYHDARRSK